MIAFKTKHFDSANYLDTPEAIAAYLSFALEGGDRGRIDQALGVVARARAKLANGPACESAVESSDRPRSGRVIRGLALRVQSAD